MFVARDAEEASKLPEFLTLMQERRAGGMGNIGELSLISGAEAKELFPALSDLPAAIHATGSARVNGRLIRDSLRNGAERYGAAIAVGRAGIVTNGGRAIGIDVAGERIAAGQVLISGGAWSAKLGEQLGVSLPVSPQRGQIMHLEMRGQETSAWPIITGFHSHYILTFPTSRVVCGATREADSGFDPTFTAGGIEEVLAQAFQVASGLRAARLLVLREGTKANPHFEQPILGAVPGWENIFVSTGHGPSGLQLGPVSSAAVSDLMLGQTPRFDLTPFSAERFL
jgi:D-amino-acid dehydrogenase